MEQAKEDERSRKLDRKSDEKRQKRHEDQNLSAQKYDTNLLITKIDDLHYKNEKLLVIETERFSHLLQAQKTIKLYESRFDEMYKATEGLKVKIEQEK